MLMDKELTITLKDEMPNGVPMRVLRVTHKLPNGDTIYSACEVKEPCDVDQLYHVYLRPQIEAVMKGID